SLRIPRPLRHPLFPYTTLFRSQETRHAQVVFPWSVRTAPVAWSGALLSAPAGPPGRGRPGRGERPADPAVRLGSPAPRPHLPERREPRRGAAQREYRRTGHRPVRGGAAAGARPCTPAAVPRPFRHPAPVVLRLPPGAPALSRLPDPPRAERRRLAGGEPPVPDPQHAHRRSAAPDAPRRGR